MNQNFDGLSYERRLELLKVNRIGLWDAYQNCVRPGSMDTDITEPELNDFTILKSIAPNIRLICFNGQGAAEPEESPVRLEYQTHLLPSSSGANRKDQIGRLSRWEAAIRFMATDFNEKYALSRSS